VELTTITAKNNTMKKLYSFIICLGLVQMTFGQISTNYNAKWFFGVNGGTTWQTTDVKNQNNWGWGLTLGKSFNYNPGTVFSWDVRGRFLRGFWYGQDKKLSDFTSPNTTLSQDPTNYQDSFGYAIHNFQTENYMFNLELVLHANRLRERTRWDAYIFGGLGMNFSQTYGDYLNTDPVTGDQSLYAWDPNNLSKSSIKNTQDGVYETALDGSAQNAYKFNTSSSLGFGLGYQVGKAVTIGLEHKTSFAQMDRFDGFNSPGKYKQDIFHYTSAYIQIRLFGKNSTRDDNVTPTPTPTVQNENMPPVVTYTQPATSGLEVANPNYIIQANITNVFDKENVTFTQNGTYKGDFVYNTKSDLFSANVVLQPGQNIFELTGSNQYGTDTKTTIIIYKREVETPPVVSFITPGSNPITVNNANYNVTGRVLNVKTKEQVQVKVNGIVKTNFTFNANNGHVDFPIVLNQGSNIVEITGTNGAGSDTKLTTIILQEVPIIQPPTVYFTDPSTSPTSVGSVNFTIRGKVLNVDGSQNVLFKQNGTSRTNFNYNPSTDDFVCTVVLNPGQNIFELYGTNAAGTASATTVIIYDRAAPKPPVVSISSPNTSPASVNSPNFQFVGTVLNVTTKSQVTFLVNGQSTTGFTFNPSNGSVVSSITLNQGVNTLLLQGTNADGTDSKQVTIVYTPVQTLQAPVVSYINPASNPTNVQLSSYPVQASVTNVSSPSGINIVCNGQNVTVYSFSNGLLNFNLNLVQGANVLTITGTNTAGSDTKTTTIIYQPAATVLPPVVTFINPNTNPINVSVANYAITASVLNVASKNDISVKINGGLTSNFTYSSTSKLVSFSTNLIVGANSIEIMGTNSAGTDVKTTTIIYREAVPQTPPTVAITQPNTSPAAVNNASYTVLANITGVTNSSQINVKVNGVSVSGYTVNIAQQTIVFPMSLAEGNNTIVITATTNTGTASDSKTIVYTKPVVVVPPTITFTSPASPGTTVNSNQFTMTAKILRIDTKQQIVLKKDGQVINNQFYSFNASTNTLSYPLTLATGNNLFEITATNDGGYANSTTNINYVRPIEPCDKPVITQLSPTIAAQVVEEESFTFKFDITNIPSATNMAFVFNGVSMTGTLGSDGKYSKTVTLNKGNNTMEVIAINACGEAHKTATVIYMPIKVPCFVPVISPIAPAAQNSTTENSAVLVQLGFANITLKTQIVFKVNNQVKAFSYDLAQNILTTEANLAIGVNLVTVTATNDCGTQTYTYTITRINCANPTISLVHSNVVNNGKTYASSFNMTLSLTEIDANNQIQVLLNNKAIAFNFSNSTNLLEVDYAINVGLAQFKVTVTNNCGTKSYTHTVTREKSPTRNAPTVSFTQPASSPISLTTGVYQVNFATSEIIDAAEIIFKVNGQNTAFTFDRLTNSGSATVNLQSGANVVTITAINPVGTATANTTINYNATRGEMSPTIKFTAPSSSPSTINLGINKIKGVVENLNNSNNIRIKVNGVAVTRIIKQVKNDQVYFEFDINAVGSSPIYIIEATVLYGRQVIVETVELRLSEAQINERLKRPEVKPTTRGGGR
jgi:hypothetical protein